MLQDLRYALRSLRLNPAFSTVALLALALGIGVNAAIFSVVHGVLLRPMPYPEPERLVYVVRQFPTGVSPSLSGMRFLEWAGGARSFSSATAYDVLGSGMNLSGAGDPERVASIRVTPKFFETFGRQPLAGRGFTEDDVAPGAGNVLVISHGLWQRRFGGDPAIVGRAVHVHGTAHRVVGVMPPDFESSPRADVWAPLRIVRDPTDAANAYSVVGRLRPDVTLAQAQAEVEAIHARFQEQDPALRSDSEAVALIPIRDLLTADVKPALLVLLGAVGLVLLIACGNVANLLLARATSRSKEMAVRLALGASPRRILVQLLIESAVLSLGGGVLGLLLGHGLLDFLLQASPPDLPRLREISMDGTVVAVVLAASLLTAFVFGLAPALQAARADVSRTLRAQGRGASSGPGTRRLRNALVMFEVALCLVLLVSATLLIRSFSGLLRTDAGFRPENVLTFKLSLAAERYPDSASVARLTRQLQGRLATLPGVLAAASATSLPLELGPDLPFLVEGRPADDRSIGGAQWRAATPDYFRVMGAALRAGRALQASDQASTEPVVVVNQALARRYFAGQDPIGARLTLGVRMGDKFADRTRLIVGVVGDMKETGLDRETPETVYLPMDQMPAFAGALLMPAVPFSWVVRSQLEPRALVPAIQNELRAVDPLVALAEVRAMSDVVDRSLAQRRFSALLLTVFAALALALAVIGVYGVISYSLAQRTHEIGIRMALGSSAGRTLRLVLGDTMKIAALGVGAGLLVALVAGKLIAGLLYGVSAFDPPTYLFAVGALLGAAALAGLIAARRALRVDPLSALQAE